MSSTKPKMIELALHKATGVLYGINQHNARFRIWERASCDSHEDMCRMGFSPLTDNYDVDLSHYPKMSPFFPNFYVRKSK